MALYIKYEVPHFLFVSRKNKGAENISDTCRIIVFRDQDEGWSNKIEFEEL
jgi:hypothetical protein